METFTIDSGYSVNCLVCLPQDPYSLYVYWEFTPVRLNSLLHHLGLPLKELKFVLRIYGRDPCAGSPEMLQEQFVSSARTAHRYFTGLKAPTFYYIELGVVTPEGQYLTLLRTPEVSLPSDKPSRSETPLRKAPAADKEIPVWHQEISSNFNWS